MRAEIKSDFEQWLIDQCTTDGDKYYLTINGQSVYIWFEGQTITASDSFVNLKIVPIDTKRVSIGAKHHSGYYRFHVHSLSPIFGDMIVDYLASLLDEERIEDSYLIDLGVCSTFQRGNKFASSTHYETIVDIDFDHWECAAVGYILGCSDILGCDEVLAC